LLDAEAAERISAIFTEVVIAPNADAAARAVFARKKNLRLLLTGGLPDPAAPG
jgi:phosphoribosylaminoimidazolecarboxamide formyltransferase/IMP cyclohydrolase